MQLKLFPGQTYVLLTYTTRSPSNTSRVRWESYPEDWGSLGSALFWGFTLGASLWLQTPGCHELVQYHRRKEKHWFFSIKLHFFRV